MQLILVKKKLIKKKLLFHIMRNLKNLTTFETPQVQESFLKVHENIQVQSHVQRNNGKKQKIHKNLKSF